MFLTAGLIALSRKVGDDRANRKEIKQQLLRDHEGKDAGSTPTANASPSRFIGSSPNAPLGVTQHALVSSPHPREVQPIPDTFIIDPNLSPENSVLAPYSPQSGSTPTSSRCSSDDAGSRSVSSGAATVTNDQDGAVCVRIRTHGSALKSGFAYHPSLFDLHVSPVLWERFTAQVLEACKFGMGDMAQMWTTATATALTGAVCTGVIVGRSVNRSIQEKKVRIGRENIEDGSLGSVLKRWNETEFNNLGLFVYLDLSQSARKREAQKSRPLRKPSLLYSKREDRERKAEERKFCITVTKLDEIRLANLEKEIHELEVLGSAKVEMPNGADALYDVAELPGEDMHPVELAVEDVNEDLQRPDGYTELEGDIASPLDKTLDNKMYIEGFLAKSDENLWPQPLMVTAETHAALNKEIA